MPEVFSSLEILVITDSSDLAGHTTHADQEIWGVKKNGNPGLKFTNFTTKGESIILFPNKPSPSNSLLDLS